jgi:glutaminyl-peptide cyclotransferase
MILRSSVVSFVVLLVGWMVPWQAAAAPAVPAGVPVVTPILVGELPHDTEAYTEGYEIDGDTLWESTGRTGHSELRDVDPNTGVVRRSVPLPPSYWSEGLTVVGDTIWELTYQNGTVIQWDKATMTKIREIPVSPDIGWGICRIGDRFMITDGSDRLRYFTTDTFTETGGVDVTRDGAAVTGLDEIECVDGQVWASLWPSDQIARIDPTTGKINLVADMSSLITGPRDKNYNVLSGIAHVQGDEFLIAPKQWPVVYRVRIPSA